VPGYPPQLQQQPPPHHQHPLQAAPINFPAAEFWERVASKAPVPPVTAQAIDTKMGRFVMNKMFFCRETHSAAHQGVERILVKMREHRFWEQVL